MSEVDKRRFKVGDKEFVVPKEIEDKKVEIYKELQQLQYQWDTMERSLVLSTGKVIRFPNQGYKGAIKNEPADIQAKAQQLLAAINKVGAKRMTLSRLLNGSVSKSLKEILSENSTMILEYFGKDYSVAEIHRICIKKGLNKIGYEDLMRFYKVNEEKIRELRNRWREDYSDISLSIKRSRLEKLNYLLNDLLQEYEKSSGANKLNFSKEVRGIIDQARREVEGDEVKLTINGRIDIEATITHYVNDAKILQDLTIHQIVISRVATRLGLSSQYLIDKLSNSFYSKFNGFRQNDDLTTKILYPSSINYDILDLEQKNRQLSTLKNANIEEAEIVPEQKAVLKIDKKILSDRISELLSSTTVLKKEGKVI